MPVSFKFLTSGGEAIPLSKVRRACEEIEVELQERLDGSSSLYGLLEYAAIGWESPAAWNESLTKDDSDYYCQYYRDYVCRRLREKLDLVKFSSWRRGVS